MDINENIFYQREGTYDGICDLCLKDFPSYDALKTHNTMTVFKLSCIKSDTR